MADLLVVKVRGSRSWRPRRPLLPAADTDWASSRITALELSTLVRDGRQAGWDPGPPAVEGGSALADVAGAEGTGGDYGGRGAENDVLEHVLCLEGGQAAGEEVAGEEQQRRHPAQ